MAFGVENEEISKYPPAKPGSLRLLAPQRGLIAIDQNQNREPFIAQSIAKFLFLSFLRKQESSFLWIPGHVSFAQNDDSMFPELSNSGSPPAEPGVYLNANYPTKGNSFLIFIRKQRAVPKSPQ